VKRKSAKETVAAVRQATPPGGKVILYRSPDGTVELNVRLDGETVWLTQEQMSRLFGRERSVITKHIRNVFKEGELDEESNVHFLHIAGSDKPVGFYNLDVIISVGYRVKSQRGTQFRIWATRTLREHLVRGYTLNRRRFEYDAAELEAALALVRKAAASAALTTDQGRGLVDVIARYPRTFLLLQRYDEGLLAEPKGHPGGVLPTVHEARAAIVRLKADLLRRGEASDLFGRERDEGLAALLGNLDQTVLGKPAYPTIESSSRTTRSLTATSASVPSCSSSSCTATGGWSGMARWCSTMSAWRRSRCWWLSPHPRTRT
jgi:hypothetical protein